MLKCIIIPAYNEFENINLILKEIYKNNFEDIRVVIVDDSKENFENKILFEKHRFVYLHRGKKLGRGSAVLFGIKYMLTLHNDIDFFVEMDSDMSHNPNELVEIYLILKIMI